jgi:hypothetical protein
VVACCSWICSVFLPVISRRDVKNLTSTFIGGHVHYIVGEIYSILCCNSDLLMLSSGLVD